MLLFLTILLERKDARFKRKWWNLKYFVIVNLHWHIETFLQILSAFVANIIFVPVWNVNPSYREFRWKFKKWRFSLRKMCTYRLMIWRNCLLFYILSNIENLAVRDIKKTKPRIHQFTNLKWFRMSLKALKMKKEGLKCFESNK